MFPWNHFENFNDYVKQLMTLKPNEIDDYVKKILANHIPYNNNSNSNEMKRDPSASTPKEKQPSVERNRKQTPLETKVFESHEDVFVQFPVKHKTDLHAGKIYYNSNQLIIKDIPNIGDKHKVLLPAIVQQRGAKTLYKNGVFQIKIPKADDLQFTEIDLNF